MPAGGTSLDSTAIGFMQRSTLNLDVTMDIVQINQTYSVLAVTQDANHLNYSDAKTTVHAFQLL